MGFAAPLRGLDLDLVVEGVRLETEWVRVGCGSVPARSLSIYGGGWVDDHFARCVASCWLRRRKVGGWRRAGWLRGLVGLAAKYFFRVLKIFFEKFRGPPAPAPAHPQFKGVFRKNKGFVFGWFSTSLDAGASVVGGVVGRRYGRRGVDLRCRSGGLELTWWLGA